MPELGRSVEHQKAGEDQEDAADGPVLKQVVISRYNNIGCAADLYDPAR
jgi:hypothetical protein